MEQRIFFREKSLYVTTDFLIEHKVPQSTIYNNTSKGCSPKRRWYSIHHPKNKKARLIAFDSIPDIIIQKYSLPSKNELFEIHRLFFLKEKEAMIVNKYNQVYKALKASYETWSILKENYDNKLFDEDKIEKLCKTESLFAACLDLLKYDMYKIKDLYKAYIQFDDVVFKAESHRSFCNKLNKMRKAESIEEELIHGLTNLPSNNTKLTEDVILEIKRIYCDPKKYNAVHIFKMVNNYLTSLNRKPISLSSVYRVISQDFVKNECTISRHGNKYTEDTFMPHSYFNLPENVGTLWAMDGSRFKFVYKTNESKFNCLTFLVIMDCASKMIIGYSCDDSENSMMALKALERSCKLTNYLPTEIILDNSKAFKSNAMVEFIAKIKLMRVYWHLIRPHNSRDNGILERFFGVFQETFCKRYDGYIGEGIKSSRLDGRPTMEELKKQMEGKNLRSREELIHLLEGLVMSYNNYKIPRKDQSPLQKFNKLSVNKEVKKLNTILYSQLFWSSKELTVRHGAILLTHNNKDYVYNIYNAEILTKIMGSKVKVRFPRDNFSKILVFDAKTDEYIITLKVFHRIPKAISDRSEEDNKALYEHVTKVKILKKDLLSNVKSIISQSEENREKIPPELTESGIVSKNEKEEAESSYLENELQNNLKTEELEDEPDETNCFEKKLQNVFHSKGSLKIIPYGKN